MRHEFRFALIGLALGLAIATMPGCTKKCDVSSCPTGCCSAAGECKPGTALDACGVGANACSTCNGGSCNAGVCSNGTVHGDGGVIVAPADAGHITCKTDDECAVLANGSVCDTRSGDCVAGKGCNDVTNCQPDDPTDPCYQLGVQCRCDTRDAPDTTTHGTCRRRKGACEPCTTDAECGDDPVIFGPPGIGYGKCRAMTGDTSGAKFCLYQRVGACSCGKVQDTEGLCRPVNNSCTEVGCRNDKNCSNNTVCTVNLPDGAGACGGVCKPRCRWDFDTRELAMPGCPGGQTCWVDSANLDAGSLFYGSGRCTAPCAGDADCKAPMNAFGGANLVCAGEKLKSGGNDAKRCRADGQCMDDFECPDLPSDQPPLGYCDKGSRTCKTDCREGSDPISGKPYRDCRMPYGCSGGTCKLLSCLQQGGANIACVRGQFCCGEDKDGDGKADPCPPVAEQDAAGCYDAPKPPFCTACMNNDSCKSPTLPAYLNGACTNGSKAPSCSTLPPICINVGQKPGGGDVKVCAVPTWNDDTKINGRFKYSLGCPQGYDIRFLRHDFAEDGINYCKSDADCNKGTTSGKCEVDPDIRYADGGTGMSCRCDANSGKSQCPQDSANNIATECRVASSGRTFCIESAVCVPGNGIAYLPPGAPYYGCGL